MTSESSHRARPEANPAMPTFQRPHTLNTRYAGFWIRAGAAIIDLGSLWLAETAVVVVVWRIGLVPLNERELAEGLGPLLAVLFWLLPAWPYFTICECSKGRGTFGKRLLGLHVTDLEGHRIGFGRANVRYWSKLFSALTLYCGFIMISFTSRKQGLHDLIAKTLVLRLEA